jgi:CMP-N-acetylneuraminic acid synthetase
VAHTIRRALQLGEWATVVVSTEDEEIAAVARQYGARVPFLRPVELAEDHTPSLPVVEHAVRAMEAEDGLEYDLVICLQPTTPLCRPADIAACVARLEENSRWASAVAVTPVSTHPLRMKRLLDDGRLLNYLDQGFEDMRPRQLLPPVYRRAGSVYASRRRVVLEEGTLVGDRCAGIVVPPETAIDIDSPLDLELARLIYDSMVQS